MTIIVDGTGSGRQAKVDGSNRLYTHAISVPESVQALEDGGSFNFNTDNITLTSAADTPLLYLKYTGTNRFLISRLVVSTKATTGGSAADKPEIRIIRNPTAGTTISNANPATIKGNKNFSSSLSFDGLVYVGATGETITDGTDALLIYGSDAGGTLTSVEISLGKGDSIALSYKPSAGNTSQVLYAALIGHVEIDT